MKLNVSFKVRNEDYYWTKEELADAKAGKGMSREEWLVISGDKVPKFSEGVGYEVDIINFKETREATIRLYFQATSKATGEEKKVRTLLEDVTVLELFHENGESTFFAVSNSIIHEYREVSPKKSKQYCYFYIKERIKYFPLGESLWLNENSYVSFMEEIDSQGLGPCKIGDLSIEVLTNSPSV